MFLMAFKNCFVCHEPRRRTVYGKIEKIEKSDGKPTIYYTYDASGNRISKQVGDAGPTTYYVRDASGNVMAIYTVSPLTGPILPGAATATVKQSEIHLYGSSRLGIYNINRDVTNLTIANHQTIITFTRGEKFFELSNHLGNVLVTISDKKIGVDANSDGVIDYYNADVITATDYYPFGMTMPGRKYTQPNSTYRYGFNGKENDKDISEGGQDYGMRIYDGRLGRFFSVDPLTKSYPMLTPYSFAENDVIRSIDLDGLEKYIVIRFFSSGILYKTILTRVTDDEIKRKGYNTNIIAVINVNNNNLPNSYHDLTNENVRTSLVRAASGSNGLKPISELNKDETSIIASNKDAAGLKTTFASGNFVEVNYKTDNADFEKNLTPAQVEDLEKIAVLFKNGLVKGKIEVEGNTSQKPTKYKGKEVTEENNQQLSEDRAQNAKKYLVEKLGIPADQINAKGVGGTNPKNPKDPKNASNQRTSVKIEIKLN